MAKINGLDKMSYAELRELRDRVDEAMVAAQAAEKKAVREEIEALAARAGLTIAEVLGGRGSTGKGSTKGTKVAVKYRNPKDPSQTWTGRGRQPNWLVDAQKKGQKLESFLV
ncbi:MAG: H-NS histone family protein [Hyphomicrobiaceae bacterium]|nr:H-NS histone family protein [Hyphomicrobiaceae bacterium]